MTPILETYEHHQQPARGLRQAFLRYDIFLSSHLARWAPLPLRLITGYGFAEHGFAKLLRGAGDFTGLLHALGLPMPALFAWLTILTEIVGGVLMLLGALVPLISIPMAVVLMVAIVSVHW